MKVEHLILARKWFEDFVADFATPEGDLPHLLLLKKEHSYRVEANSGSLAAALEWEGDAVRIADVLGLLHDIGRFPQYRDYGTFSDGSSIDHGDAGVTILERSFPWSGISPSTKKILLEGIRYHNKMDIADTLSPEERTLCQLVRDADKIDILALIRQCIKEGKVQELSPGLKEDVPVSPDLLEDLVSTGKASYKKVHSLTDFLALQLSWVFDINYPQTFQMLEEAGSLSWIVDQLQKEKELLPFIEEAMKHVEAQLALL
ncbi:HD domain-containing protein [Aminobacterium mobile]|uniref:HD domain-containing protein n=1 Tax=Aminobacterium mobile TaxID=81467 RepID=UPI0004678A94|nr:HD domain-containing protein [Aminobacterium mobile]